MKSITESRYRAAVEEAAHWIDQSFTVPLKLNDAAKVASMSPYHFLRVFAAMLGETPADYVRRRRVERSLQLLAATNYSVQAVASMSGFESGSLLCHVMARTVGVSPTVFRQQERARSLGAVRAPALGDTPARLPLQDKPIALLYLQEQRALMRMACGLRRRSFTGSVGP
ncbi:MAG: helix-turn-helix domain-containing protein, partial [Burkholderiaceae bacterium]